MPYSVTKLVSNSFYISSIVSRDFEGVSGNQINDGVDILNDLLNDKDIDNGMLPYYKKYDLVLTQGISEYFIENLRNVDTYTFFIDTVRYSTSRQSRRQFFGNSRPMNVESLPGAWHFEKQKGGGTLYVFFIPSQEYAIQIWGQFGLDNVALNDDLELTYDRFYINYLKYELAVRLCTEYSWKVPADVLKQYNRYCELIRNESSILDLKTQKISSLSSNGFINYAQVNIGRGFWPY